MTVRYSDQSKKFIPFKKLDFMNTSLLFQNFPDESSCIQTLKEKRLQVGVVCKKCSHTEHYFRKGDLKFECKKCKSRQSIRTGTVMENSNRLTTIVGTSFKAD